MNEISLSSLFLFLFATLGLYAHETPRIPLADVLDSQGHIVNNSQLSGSVDFSGYTPIIDSVVGLRFVPALPLTSGWNAIGTGLDGFVYTVATYGSDVYVGGAFTDAGGNANADKIARWDGSSWNALGTGFSGSVFTIAISGSDVYIGGNFIFAGGTIANNIARWNGSSWNALGTGLNNYVYTIAISDSNVYVGGLFTDAGGNAFADNIARWNGSSWSALGTGLSSVVNKIAISGNDVYVGGNFADAGGNAEADYIARWNGNSWNALGTGLSSVVRAIAISGSDVYVGGGFMDAGGNAEADYIARWEVSSLPVEWVALEAKQQAQAVQVAWTVATQINNIGWHIEHSTDGIYWVRVGWVAGDGNQQKLSNYGFLHADPAKGQNYYRLQQVDYDGQFEYSKIVNVQIKNSASIQFFPNPATGSVTLVLETDYSSEATLSLFDATGKQVKNQTLPLKSGTFRLSIGLGDLPPGIYMAQVQAGQEQWRERLVVE